jgi:hypothetical protein
MNLPDALVRGDMPAGWAANRSGVPAENDGLLSLALSPKGGEGNGAPTRERRDACKGQGRHLRPKVKFDLQRNCGSIVVVLNYE